MKKFLMLATLGLGLGTFGVMSAPAHAATPGTIGFAAAASEAVAGGSLVDEVRYHRRGRGGYGRGYRGRGNGYGYRHRGYSMPPGQYRRSRMYL